MDSKLALEERLKEFGSPDIVEVSDSNGFHIRFQVDLPGVGPTVFREGSNGLITDVSKDQSYQRILFYFNEHLAGTGEYRRAHMDAWMKNVIDGNADKMGEFVPSRKQVEDQLKQNLQNQ